MLGILEVGEMIGTDWNLLELIIIYDDLFTNAISKSQQELIKKSGELFALPNLLLHIRCK